MRGKGAERPGSRRWTWVALAAGLVTALSIPLLGVAAARTLGDSKAGKLDVPTGTVGVVSADTPGALLVAKDGNDVIGLTVLALQPSGAGGTAVVVPVGSEATVDGFDRPTRLANAYQKGGLDAEATATEGLLGVTFSTEQEVDRDGLLALLAPLGPITVTLSDPVLRTGANGQDEQVLPGGRQTITAQQAVSALYARRANESEILRTPAQVAIWQGIVQAAQTVAKEADTAQPPATVAGYLGALGAGPRAVRTLDVTPALDVVTNPDAIDLLQVDSASTQLLMARILPTAVSPTNGGLRVRLRNQTGDNSALYQATVRLLFAGANVVAVDDTPSAGVSVGTRLEYDPSLTQDRIEGLTVAIGPASAAPAKARVDGVDVTVDLGQDFLAFLKKGTSSGGDVPPTAGGG